MASDRQLVPTVELDQPGPGVGVGACRAGHHLPAHQSARPSVAASASVAAIISVASLATAAT